jgi:hypothetical protein
MIKKSPKKLSNYFLNSYLERKIEKLKEQYPEEEIEEYGK